MNKQNLRRAIPEYEHAAVRAINEGGENRVFEIDGKTILKIPRQEEYESKIEKEILFLSRAGEGLREYLPRFVRKIGGTYEFEKLPGKSCGIHAGQIRISGNVARQIGSFLSILHSLENRNAFQEFIASKYFSIHTSMVNLGRTINQEWQAPTELIRRQFENSTGVRYYG